MVGEALQPTPPKRTAFALEIRREVEALLRRKFRFVPPASGVVERPDKPSVREQSELLDNRAGGVEASGSAMHERQ